MHLQVLMHTDADSEPSLVIQHKKFEKNLRTDENRPMIFIDLLVHGVRDELITVLGVVTASPEAEAGSSRAKIDVAFFGWFWLIVESGIILHLRRPLRANPSTAEVKKERVEAFTYKSFICSLVLLCTQLPSR